MVKVILVEEIVFHPPESMEDYRYFRMEYGGVNEETIISGSIWVPAWIDPEEIEILLNTPPEDPAFAVNIL